MKRFWQQGNPLKRPDSGLIPVFVCAALFHGVILVIFAVEMDRADPPEPSRPFVVLLSGEAEVAPTAIDEHAALFDSRPLFFPKSDSVSLNDDLLLETTGVLFPDYPDQLTLDDETLADAATVEPDAWQTLEVREDRVELLESFGRREVSASSELEAIVVEVRRQYDGTLVQRVLLPETLFSVFEDYYGPPITFSLVVDPALPSIRPVLTQPVEAANLVEVLTNYLSVPGNLPPLPSGTYIILVGF